MSLNDFNQVNDTNKLVQDFWSPIYDKELRQNNLWTGLFQDPNYTMERFANGSAAGGGDTFKITRINKPSSSIKTIGVDADSFSSNILSTTQVELAVTKRCVSSFKFSDLAILLSQLEQEDSEIREAMLADVRQQANTFIQSLVSPSSSAPAHVLTSVSDFNLAQLSAVRKLAAQAKWKSSGQPWFLLADPSYYSDLIDDTTLSSAQTMGIGKSPVLEGMFEYKRMGFNIAEDDSLATDKAYAILGNGLKVVVGSPVFKISDLHPLGQFGFMMSVDFPLGAVQMEDTRVISIAN